MTSWIDFFGLLCGTSGLSKAFDIVYHEQLLLAKVEYYDIKVSAIYWMRLYLGCREQFVEMGPFPSTELYTIECTTRACARAVNFFW